MKKLLLSATLIFFFIFANAQTVTWTGASGIDNDWNTDSNWDTGSIPTAINDVVIPDGFTVDLDTPGGDVLSLTLGASVFNIGTNFQFANTFNIAATGTVNWNLGTISGNGVLTNEGTINLFGSNGTLGNVSSAPTLENNGTINLTGIGDIFLYTNAVLNNNSGGVIDIQSPSSGISRSSSPPHVVNNEGIIKTTPPLGTDQVAMNIQLKNNGGTLQVENGILNLTGDNVNPNEFNGGLYNIFSGTTLNLSNTTVFSGNVGGAINGTLNITGFIAVPVAATVDFGGTEIINFSGVVNGGGTLTNRSIITIANQPVRIQGGSTLLNQDIIEFTSFGDLFVDTNSTLNNDAAGTIDFKGDTGNIQSGGGAPNQFLNTGLITTSFTGDGSDTAQISAEFVNNGGTIEINNGTLSLNKVGIELNGGIYNIASNGIFDWDNDVNISGSLTGNIQGLLNWKSKVNILTTASLDFSGTQIISWNVGNIDGGGVLTNNNIMNIGSFNVFIFGGTTLNNNATINFLDTDDLFIAENGVLNNQMLGTINFLGNGSSIGINGVAPRTFNNNGNIIVDLPNPSDSALITAEFNNNNGTIEIRSGTLNLSNTTANAQNLNDGVYNIFADGAFDWDSNVTVSGELTGQVDGPINWRSILWVNTATTATFFFTGLKTIFWSPGSLNGGGTLINRSTINITNTGTVNINGGTTFNNGGDLIFSTFGDLGVTTNSTINNLVEGTIEFQASGANIFPSGGAPQIFNNLGTLKTSAPGIVGVNIETNNSGSIEINSGELEFANGIVLHNQATGIIKGTGTLDIPSAANFTNDGTIAPGTSPGTLTVLGDYSSTSSAVLDIELDGLIQGTEFDFIPITGNNIVFDGSINLTLGFNANVNDEFVIATTTGTINTCSLNSPVSATFGGFNYDFDVICRNDNEVVLTVTNQTLSSDTNEFLEKSITVYPNPATHEITLKNTSNITLTSATIVGIDGSSIDNINLREIGQQATFSLANYASGIYFMRINSENSTVVKKLVKL